MWQPEQPSSHIVASRGFFMCWHSRFAASSVTKLLRLVISSTAWPFSTSAPVGQTCTHLPQLVQDGASPHGRLSSATSIELMPRAEMSQTCAPFDFVADAHAARAQDAAIVVEHPARVRHVDRQAREVVRQVDMGEPEGLRQRLQFAIAVGDTDGADMVALDEQQLQRHQPVVRKAVGVGGDRHAVLCRCRAGGQQAADAGDLDQAQTAGPGELKPSRWHSDGMYLPFACATWKMVCPSVAVQSSLSMRTEICCGTGMAPYRRATACSAVSRMSQRRQRHASSCASSGRSADTASSKVLARTARAGNVRGGVRRGSSCGGVWSYCENRHDAVVAGLRP